MYRIDQNNVITRIADGKIIVRDITNMDYQTFLYVQANHVDPQSHNMVNVFSARGDK